MVGKDKVGASKIFRIDTNSRGTVETFDRKSSKIGASITYDFNIGSRSISNKKLNSYIVKKLKESLKSNLDDFWLIDNKFFIVTDIPVNKGSKINISIDLTIYRDIERMNFKEMFPISEEICYHMFYVLKDIEDNYEGEQLLVTIVYYH